MFGTTKKIETSERTFFTVGTNYSFIGNPPDISIKFYCKPNDIEDPYKAGFLASIELDADKAKKLIKTLKEMVEEIEPKKKRDKKQKPVIEETKTLADIFRK
jgi:hypothetical protein